VSPGLTDDQIDAQTNAVGLVLPDEARTWWRWHDGANSNAPLQVQDIGPGCRFLSLADAIDSTLEWRGIFDDTGIPWPPGWLTLNDNKCPLIIDCDRSADQPAHIHMYSPEDGLRPWRQGVGAGSFAELVSVWVEAMDCGAWTYNNEAQYWEWSLERMTPRIRGRGLV
jgi:hypothetical protein